MHRTKLDKSPMAKLLRYGLDMAAFLTPHEVGPTYIRLVTNAYTVLPHWPLAKIYLYFRMIEDRSEVWNGNQSFRQVGNIVYSCAMNGLAISSSPSTGLSSVMVGPRRTVRPSERMCTSGSTSFLFDGH